MPHQLEAFKLAERGNLDVKGLSRLMIILTISRDAAVHLHAGRYIL